MRRITFNLEDDKDIETDFVDENLAFVLKTMKIIIVSFLRRRRNFYIFFTTIKNKSNRSVLGINLYERKKSLS